MLHNKFGRNSNFSEREIFCEDGILCTQHSFPKSMESINNIATLLGELAAARYYYTSLKSSLTDAFLPN